MTKAKPPFGAIPLTSAARAYFAENHRLAALKTFLANGTAALQRLVKSTFDATPESVEARAQLGAELGYEKDETPPYPEEINFAFHRPFVAQLLVAHYVDNFACYLTDLLTLIFVARPEMLRSSKATEPLDFILQYDDMPSLRHALAEKRVISCAFKGMRELNDELLKQHGISLFPVPAELEEVVYWSEVRNLVYHNRGVVNKLSGSRSPKLATAVGQRVPIDWTSVRAAELFLRTATVSIDESCAKKFKLTVEKGNLVPAELRP